MHAAFMTGRGTMRSMVEGARARGIRPEGSVLV